MNTYLLVSRFAIAFLAGGVLALSGCGDPRDTTSSPSPNGGITAYPLKTCLVTDNDLGSMGDEQRIVYQGRELKFCCKPCVDKFMKNPDKYLLKLRS